MALNNINRQPPGEHMTAKFAHYSALSEASRQVSQEMKNLQKSFKAAKPTPQSGQKGTGSVSSQRKASTKAGKSRA